MGDVTLIGLGFQGNASNRFQSTNPNQAPGGASFYACAVVQVKESLLSSPTQCTYFGNYGVNRGWDIGRSTDTPASDPPNTPEFVTFRARFGLGGSTTTLEYTCDASSIFGRTFLLGASLVGGIATLYVNAAAVASDTLGGVLALGNVGLTYGNVAGGGQRSGDPVVAAAYTDSDAADFIANQRALFDLLRSSGKLNASIDVLSLVAAYVYESFQQKSPSNSVPTVPLKNFGTAGVNGALTFAGTTALFVNADPDPDYTGGAQSPSSGPGAVNLQDAYDAGPTGLIVTGVPGPVGVDDIRLENETISTTDSAAVPTLTLQGGEDTVGGQGGSISILAGASPVGGGLGGSVRIEGGVGESQGGPLIFTSGAGPLSGSAEFATGQGLSVGELRVKGGDAVGVGSTQGGDVVVQAGAASQALQQGGTASLTAGSSPAGRGGDTNIEAGTGGAGPGGEVTIIGGDGSTAGGDVNIFAGSGTSDVGGDIDIAAGSSAAADGGRVDVKAGDSAGGGIAGTVSIIGGNASAPSSAGDVNVVSGSGIDVPGGGITVTASDGGIDGTLGLQGGSVVIRSGGGGAGTDPDPGANGGQVVIASGGGGDGTGAASQAGNGGELNISAGNAGTAAGGAAEGTGGRLRLSAGTGGAGFGGDTQIVSGNGDTQSGNIDITVGTSEGVVGLLSLTGGPANGLASGPGGGVAITGGDSANGASQNGGNVNITGGLGDLSPGQGGDVGIIGGTTRVSGGPGGSVTIEGGTGGGGIIDNGGFGGPVTITGGDATQENQPAGEVRLAGGDATGAGLPARGGDVQLRGGASTNSGGGVMLITSGSGPTPEDAGNIEAAFAGNTGGVGATIGGFFLDPATGRLTLRTYTVGGVDTGTTRLHQLNTAGEAAQVVDDGILHYRTQQGAGTETTVGFRAAKSGNYGLVSRIFQRTFTAAEGVTFAVAHNLDCNAPGVFMYNSATGALIPIVAVVQNTTDQVTVTIGGAVDGFVTVIGF